MPNWCENKLILRVIDDSSDNYLEKFVLENKTEDEELSFECSVSVPDTVYKGNLGQKEREKYGVLCAFVKLHLGDRIERKKTCLI